MRAPPPARPGNRLWRRELPTWYSPAYRLPITGLEGSLGMEPRRADYVVWWLLESRALSRACLRAPPRISYEELDRVHTLELIESLGRPETLARIFAADPSDVPVDALMDAVRLACGGTLAAAREALRRCGPTLNLLGGFHHAFPAAAGGFCPVNDVATELAGVPSVWLPGGGYHPEAWRLLAGTAMALALRSRAAIPARYDPLSRRFRHISAQLIAAELGETEFTAADLEESLGLRVQRGRQRLLLGYYTAAGLEHALYRYGVLDHLRRVGYDGFRRSEER